MNRPALPTCRRVIRWCVLLIILTTVPLFSGAESFQISTPGGDITVEVPHVAPQGSLVEAAAPTSPGFRPPAIFSAPLPSGSGARALGLADSFTAVADDATAASWNPGGLIQLEEPEFSLTFRLSRETTRHRSASGDYRVGDEETSMANLNYMSFVYPFQAAERNMVISINLQEAFDFAQKFSSQSRDQSTSSERDSASGVFTDVVDEHVVDGNTELDITSVLTTRKTSVFDQLIQSELINNLEFEQEGIVYAISPAFAAEITPKLSFGAAVNIYLDGSSAGQGIESTTKANYSGNTESRVEVTDTMTTSGTYEYDGVFHMPAGGGIPFPIDIPFSGSGEFEPFTDTAKSTDRKQVYVDGVYEEINEFDDFWGVNLTLGSLWTVSRKLRLGATIDLPWTAEGRQKKTVRNTMTTYNQTKTQVLDVSSTDETTTKDVEFDFPLRWAVGALWRWTDLLYTTLDISCTHWSDFSFKAEGEQRINPLDGSPYGENPIDDTWRISSGIEYLMLFRKTEVPLRAGVAWEERPAVDEPDEFWHFTLGSGVSIGQGKGKIIIDVAYVYTRGENVLGSLVSETGLNTDVDEHQVFVSLIKHL